MKNDDLISRAAAIKEVLGMCPEKTEPGSFDEYGVTVLCGVVDVILKQLPAVDAVPVVRCKDCHYWHQELDEVHHWYCTYGWAHQTTPDHYCADGKRRESDA